MLSQFDCVFIDSVQVNSNGHVSFGTEVPAYRGNLILHIGLPVIAPFLSDVDTGITGDVFYRSVSNVRRLTQR